MPAKLFRKQVHSVTWPMRKCSNDKVNTFVAFPMMSSAELTVLMQFLYQKSDSLPPTWQSVQAFDFNTTMRRLNYPSHSLLQTLHCSVSLLYTVSAQRYRQTQNIHTLNVDKTYIIIYTQSYTHNYTLACTHTEHRQSCTQIHIQTQTDTHIHTHKQADSCTG